MSPYRDPAGPVAWEGGHPSESLLTSYAAGTVETIVVWSVEAHLSGCPRCRSALSAQVDSGRLARNRSAVLVGVALPRRGWVRRLLGRCGIPDYLLDLIAATPSMRRSWLLSVVGVLAVVAGEAVAVRYGSITSGGRPALAGFHDPAVLTPFLLVAPLVVLAGVAVAFLPMFDPACRLAAAAPFSGMRLLLVRTVAAMAAALIPVVVGAFVVPGPGWLPVALLLPSLALCALALAAATVMDPRVAAIAAGSMWALPALVLAVSRVPLLIVQQTAQVGCAAVLCGCVVVLYLRHDRFEVGWTK